MTSNTITTTRWPSGACTKAWPPTTSCGSGQNWVASYSLHNLPKSRLDAALAGLREVLAPGGVLVIITHGGSGEELLDQPEGEYPAEKIRISARR